MSQAAVQTLKLPLRTQSSPPSLDIFSSDDTRYSSGRYMVSSKTLFSVNHTVLRHHWGTPLCCPIQSADAAAPQTQLLEHPCQQKFPKCVPQKLVRHCRHDVWGSPCGTEITQEGSRDFTTARKQSCCLDRERVPTPGSVCSHCLINQAHF